MRSPGPSSVPSRLDQALAQGLEHHRAGRYAQAEVLYRQVLTQDPRHPDALHLLGLLAHAAGQHEAAISLIQGAIVASPRSGVFYSNLGLALAARGRTPEAVAACRRSVELEPSLADAWRRLGDVLLKAGENAEALGAYERALTLEPRDLVALCHKGDVLLRLMRTDEAIAAYERALAINPKHAPARHNLGNIRQALGRFEEAEAEYRAALEIDPDMIEPLEALVMMLVDQGMIERAAEVMQGYAEPGREQEKIAFVAALLRRAVQRRPDSRRLRQALANVLLMTGEPADAERHARRAMELGEETSKLRNILGYALYSLDRLDEAKEQWLRAVELAPNDREALYNLAIGCLRRGDFAESLSLWPRVAQAAAGDRRHECNEAKLLMMLGRFEEGLAKNETRYAHPRLQPLRRYPRPLLTEVREDPAAWGSRVFIYIDEGLGDTLNFIRYVPLVARHGLKDGQPPRAVIVECQRELMELVRGVEGVTSVRPMHSPPPSIDEFDSYSPLMSLPYVVGTRLETIPAKVPYITPDPARVAAWRGRVHEGALRVGLAWAGNPKHTNDRNRSMALADLAPLAGVEGVVFYSLQKGPAAEQIGKAPAGMTIIDLGRDIADFSDTAAVLANLDLLISVDTSVVHMAGAMGAPAWVLLPFVPDWRWLLDRDDSPWYPTLRLFRQKGHKDWASVVEKILPELARLRDQKKTRA